MVGAGAAGMYVALRAAEAGARVVLVLRKHLRESVQESASFWAQGGLAAALAPDDSPDRHRQDTIAAGRGLCRAAAVEALVREAPEAVEELVARGVGFGPDRRSLALALEGGHSARRIVHAGGSATGKALTDRLIELVEASPTIDVRERSSVVALWGDRERCAGVITDHGPAGGPGDGAGHRRRSGAVGPHHQPLRCDRRRVGARAGCRGGPGRSGVLPVPTRPRWRFPAQTRMARC